MSSNNGSDCRGGNYGISWLYYGQYNIKLLFFASPYFSKCVIFQHISEPVFQANSSCFYLT